MPPLADAIRRHISQSLIFADTIADAAKKLIIEITSLY